MPTLYSCFRSFLYAFFHRFRCKFWYDFRLAFPNNQNSFFNLHFTYNVESDEYWAPHSSTSYDTWPRDSPHFDNQKSQATKILWILLPWILCSRHSLNYLFLSPMKTYCLHTPSNTMMTMSKSIVLYGVPLVDLVSSTYMLPCCYNIFLFFFPKKNLLPLVKKKYIG